MNKFIDIYNIFILLRLKNVDSSTFIYVQAQTCSIPIREVDRSLSVRQRMRSRRKNEMTQEELNKRAKDAVMAYNADGAKAVASDAIAAKADLVDLIQSGFTLGIKEIGRLFEEKKVFLPHIMAAAAAMNAGVDLLEPEITKQGKGTDEGLGTFVICSIEGDIHSIGKDIVAIMLKVAGFDVLNIGRDVPLKEIMAACQDNKAKYVGTSALMTSTMVNQKAFEELLTKDGIRKKLITNVGGAPVTQQWADEIGADVYSENAADAVAKMTKIAG